MTTGSSPTKYELSPRVGDGLETKESASTKKLLLAGEIVTYTFALTNTGNGTTRKAHQEAPLRRAGTAPLVTLVNPEC